MGEDVGAFINRRDLVSFHLLGPFRVRQNGCDLRLPSARLRWLLAVLVAHEGQVVSDARLIEHVWGSEPCSRAALQTAASRLRAWLARLGLTLSSENGGYRLRAPLNSIDSHSFRRCMANSGGQSSALDRFRELKAWFEVGWDLPLADAPDCVHSDPAVVALAHLRREGLLAFSASAREIGQPTVALPALAHLCLESPHDEPVHAEFLRLLAADGRPAEALLHYDELRTRLRDDLGVAPGEEVQLAHRALLAADADVDDGVALLRAPVPAQLPPPNPRFAGRRTDVARLDDALADAGAASTICVVVGTAGVGKSALAVHWAHRVRDRFPDGQLFVNLRGFDPGGQPLAPAEVIRGFITALAGEAQRVPHDLAGQTGLYRSLVAERRLLIVLDNARDVVQVRPLLPGAGQCLVIVTSRRQLTGLVAEGGHAIVLDTLSELDSQELLSCCLGPSRMDGEPQSVSAIIDRCAGLPMALAVVAARAALNPAQPLAVIADDLATGLDGVDDGDPNGNARAVFSWSYQALHPSAARLFRLMTLHPGPTAAAEALAAMADLTPDQLRPLLTELVQTSLLVRVGRHYAVHDLLRRYGMELAETIDSTASIQTARVRLLTHYLHRARQANELLYHQGPTQADPQMLATEREVQRKPFAGTEEASDWMRDNYFGLLGVVRVAAETELDPYAWRLAQALHQYAVHRDRWHDLSTCLDIAVDAATRDRELWAAAFLRRRLADAYGYLGRRSEAEAELERVLLFANETADPLMRGDVHLTFAVLYQDEPATAREYAERSLADYRAADDVEGEGKALNALGWLHASLDDPETGVVYARSAVAIHVSIGSARAGDSWDTLGVIYGRLGRYDDAVVAYREAISVYRRAGNQMGLAETLTRLAETQAAQDADVAQQTREAARVIYDEIEATANPWPHRGQRQPSGADV